MLMALLIYCYNWQDILKLDQFEKRLITYMMKEWSTAVALRVDLKVSSITANRSYNIVYMKKLARTLHGSKQTLLGSKQTLPGSKQTLPGSK